MIRLQLRSTKKKTKVYNNVCEWVRERERERTWEWIGSNAEARIVFIKEKEVMVVIDFSVDGYFEFSDIKNKNINKGIE